MSRTVVPRAMVVALTLALSGLSCSRVGAQNRADSSFTVVFRAAPRELMLRLSRDRLGFFREMVRRNGDISSLRIGSQRVVMLTHPDHIRDVLVTHGRQFTKGRALAWLADYYGVTLP